MFNRNINLNLYKVFYDVCKYGSFSKTAEFTYTTQSAISKSIKKLEDDLETKLFYRNSNGIELTDKGRELFYYVEKSYGNLLTAERIMLETENLERGKLNIGLPSHIASFFFFDGEKIDKPGVLVVRRIAVDHPCPPVAARIRKNAEAPVWRERGLIGAFKRRGELLPSLLL